MGYDIVYYRTGSHDTIPEEFEYRYSIWPEFISVLWKCDVDTITDCCCSSGKHAYMCVAPDYARPKNFSQFRDKLAETEAMSECTILPDVLDYLEKNTNVYVGYSN